MPRPSHQHTLSSRAQLFAHGHHVRHSLTWMMHSRFQIDDRHAGIFSESVQDRIKPFLFPVLQGRERSHAHTSAITTEHANELGHVLCLISIHHHAVSMLNRPASSARLQNDSVPAKLEHAHLHRSARAQTRIEEDQSNRAPYKRHTAIIATLELEGRFNQLLKFVARPVPCCQKISRHLNYSDENSFQF